MHIDNVDLEHFPTNEVAQRLLTYVTRGWYDKSYVGKWIYEVIGLELETASRRISEAQKQAQTKRTTTHTEKESLKSFAPQRFPL